MRSTAALLSLGIVLAQYEHHVPKKPKACTQDDADEVINQLHDDLDDDDDGAISNVENRAFISEYGGPSSSIGALLDDNDGRVSKSEFLNAWRTSAVHNWTTDDVIVWLKSADLNFPTELAEKLGVLFSKAKIDGTCFPLLAKLEQTFLKQLGIKQHLVRRKIALRSMDAILFGPPVYDNTIKDFVLAILAVFVFFSVTFIFRLKRQFHDVQARLQAESTRLSDLDHMWKEFSGDSPGGDNDSASTIMDLPAELSQLSTYKRENEQLRRSLEEAHRELRTMQDGGSIDHCQINSELKSLLQRTYRIEKEQLDTRRSDARRREKAARENMRKIQRANDSFFSSVRLIHSQQLDQVDTAIHHAQTAIEEVMLWQRDCRDRWRKLEMIFRVNFILKSGSTQMKPAAVPDGLPPSISSDRLQRSTRVGKSLKLKRRSLLGTHVSFKGILQHQHSVENSITEFGSKQSTVSEDSCLPKSQVSTAESSPKTEINGNIPHNQLEQSYHNGMQLGLPGSSHSSSVLPESSIDSGSVTSSQSHIKVKKNRFPKLFDRKKFASLSFRRHKTPKHKD